MEIPPLELDGKTGAEARQGGTRLAHVVGRLDEAESRAKHAWVGLDDHSLAPGEAPELYAGVYAEAGDPWVEAGHLTLIVVVPDDESLLRIWFLPVAGTRPDVRGRRVGRALTEHILHRAHEDGYRTVLADWRSTNLLASRLWPARGFVPTHVRLRRDVQPAV